LIEPWASKAFASSLSSSSSRVINIWTSYFRPDKTVAFEAALAFLLMIIE